MVKDMNFGTWLSGEFKLTWAKITVKEISAEKAGLLRLKGKIDLTMSPKFALNMVNQRRKRFIYRLPNGIYGVMV